MSEPLNAYTTPPPPVPTGMQSFGLTAVSSEMQRILAYIENTVFHTTRGTCYYDELDGSYQLYLHLEAADWAAFPSLGVTSEIWIRTKGTNDRIQNWLQ